MELDINNKIIDLKNEIIQKILKYVKIGSSINFCDTTLNVVNPDNYLYADLTIKSIINVDNELIVKVEQFDDCLFLHDFLLEDLVKVMCIIKERN